MDLNLNDFVFSERSVEVRNIIDRNSKNMPPKLFTGIAETYRENAFKCEAIKPYAPYT